MRHTILGAGGSIGNALANELLNKNETLRLVSRSNYSISGAESFKADITSYEETLNSIKDSDIVYLCAGLPYDSKIWADLWPKIMRNSITACKSIGAKFIFFDNVYMYGKVNGTMTESTPYNPISRKGEIRATIVTLLEDEIKQKNLDAIIARSADLYGPYATQTSLPYILVIDKLMNGEKAQWMLNDNTLHSYSYTIDCAKGLSLLSCRNECYNQIWHLPTFNPSINGKTFINMVAKELGVRPNYSVLKKWMIKMAGMFNPKVFESIEMLYQSEFDYVFDSTKFNEFFNYKPISYQAGIQETIAFLKKKGSVIK